MFENSAMNGGDGARQEVERFLAALKPEALQVHREELFFQAGCAAGAKSAFHFKILSVSAAALLLICLGLGGALAYQTASLHQIQAAARETSDIKLADANGATSPSPASRNEFDTTAPPNIELRHLQRLASPVPLPAGRLTALGWESAQRMGNGEWGMGNDRHMESSESFSTPESTQPRRPSTYFDLLRLQQEG